MRNQDALALLSKHKHLIIVAIGVAALVSYMIPLGNLFTFADATGSHWFKKTKSHDSKFDKFKKDFFAKLFKVKVSDSFNTFKVNVDIDNKVKGGDIKNIAYTGGDGGGALISGGATAINFGSTYTIVNNNVQVCVLVTTCANSGITTAISTTNNFQAQYSQFGGISGV